MTLDLDREDLENMLKGIQPGRWMGKTDYDLRTYGNPVYKNDYVRWSWKSFLFHEMTDQEVYDLYIKIKERNKAWPY